MKSKYNWNEPNINSFSYNAPSFNPALYKFLNFCISYAINTKNIITATYEIIKSNVDDLKINIFNNVEMIIDINPIDK